MPYDPDGHHRRSMRLPGYDYAQPGAYFVTVCVRNRECILGSMEDGGMRLSGFGEMVEECWRALPGHFPNVTLDAFVIMPNHVHGIITILASGSRDGNVGAQHAAPLPDGTPPGGPSTNVAAGSLGAMIRSFKAAVSREARARRGVSLPFWQRGYYEHVIRSEDDLDRVRRYILDNPAGWATDRDNPENTQGRV